MIIHVNETYLLMNYIIAIITTIIISVILKMPILPEKPRRFSWTNSAIFPTTIISLGLLAICFSLDFFWIYDGMILSIIISVLSVIFVKYLFNMVFPKPSNDLEGENE